MMPNNLLLKGILILFVFTMLLNLPYIHLREFQGEEGKRVIIAKNMIETGDWIVPYMEGKVYLSKPPLYNWLLAWVFKISGTISEASARIPSVAAAFLCALSLSLFLRRIAAIKDLRFILPGLIFLTFTDVMDKAIRAEIDMTFTLLVTLSLLIWFYYFEVRKKELFAWVISLSFVGISVLTKGVQAPAFFYCGVIPYLFYKKRIKKIFSFQHIAGISVFLTIFCLWFVPFTARINVGDVFQAWLREIILRKEPLREGGFLRRFVEFPLQYVFAYLPWIPFLLLWLQKPLKKESSIMKDLTVYCLFPLLISVPVYWLIPGARIRYIMPLSGMLAILIYIPLNALMRGEIEDSKLGKRYMQALGVIIILLSISSPFWGKKFELFERTFSVFLLVAIFFISVPLVWLKRDIGKKIVLLLLTALLIKIFWASFYFPYHADHKSYYRKAAIQLNILAPPDATLYGYRVDNGNLAYYLNRPVLLIESLDEVFIKRGSIVFVEDDDAQSPDLRGFFYIGKVKARGTNLLLYGADGSSRP